MNKKIKGDAPHPSRADKLATLQEAIADYQPGDNELIDRVEEEKLAPIRAKAVRLINHRARSEHELRQRLLDADFAPELVDTVVHRCLDNGMIDDATFAREWVRQRQEHQKKSRSVLRRELYAKGIDEALINDALEQVSDEDQQDILWTLVWKKVQTVKEKPTSFAEYNKVLRKVVGVAARRGFPEGQAMEMGKQALEKRWEQLL